MTTFWDIVFGGDNITILLWLTIFGLIMFSFIIGIISIIQSGIRKSRYYPLSFKLLVYSLIFSLMFGALLTSYTMIQATTPTDAHGAGHQAALAFYISNSMYGLAIAFSGALPHLFFIFFSIIILHFKKPQSKLITEV